MKKNVPKIFFVSSRTHDPKYFSAVPELDPKTTSEASKLKLRLTIPSIQEILIPWATFFEPQPTQQPRKNRYRAWESSLRPSEAQTCTGVEAGHVSGLGAASPTSR